MDSDRNHEKNLPLGNPKGIFILRFLGKAELFLGSNLTQEAPSAPDQVNHKELKHFHGQGHLLPETITSGPHRSWDQDKALKSCLQVAPMGFSTFWQVPKFKVEASRWGGDRTMCLVL